LTIEEQTRRQFCAQACQGTALAALGAALGSVLQGCGGGSSPSAPSGIAALPVINAPVSNGEVVLTIDSSSPLAAVGSAALVQSSSGNLLVAHTAQDAFVALTSICTHQNCTITGFANQLYVCPCHGSEYSMSGQVVRGPAPSALRQFQTQFNNGVLTVG
jgi:cytochrome b6-f complex iron-sulfur subunit